MSRNDSIEIHVTFWTYSRLKICQKIMMKMGFLGIKTIIPQKIWRIYRVWNFHLPNFNTLGGLLVENDEYCWPKILFLQKRTERHRSYKSPFDMFLFFIHTYVLRSFAWRQQMIARTFCRNLTKCIRRKRRMNRPEDAVA